MTRWKLYLLGSPRLERDGESVPMRRRKTMALLAHLAVTGRTHQREALATLLWPEWAASSARADLRRTLSLVNRALGGSAMVADREAAGLDPEFDLWADVVAFRHALAACEAHKHPIGEACEACVPGLEEAVALYQDDFLAGFTLEAGAAFDEWQFFEAQALRDAAAGALARLVTWHAAQGERSTERAIAYARRWLALDPLHEPAHQQLMALYFRAGQRSAALRQYRLCLSILEEELGVPPSEATKELYEQVRSKAPPASPSPILQSQRATPPNNLPAQLTPLIGREHELAAIGEALETPTCRLLTLTGPGGIGKTRLALEAAAQQLDRSPDGVFLVELAPHRNPEALVPAIAEAICLPSGNRRVPRERQLHSYLRDRTLLLLLDNVEHLLPTGVGGAHDGSGPDPATLTASIDRLLRAAPGVKLLVTSRRRLNMLGEHALPVGSLAFPEDACESLDGLAALPAVRLVVDAARRVRPHFAVTEANRAAVSALCRAVEGHPLALLLSAAWLSTLSTGEIAAALTCSEPDGIGSHLDLLQAEWTNAPPRHRSLRAAFEGSWQLLKPRERAVFQTLSVFRGSFTQAAALAVSGGTHQDLRALVEASLLRRAPPGRYTLHELLRACAWEKLERDPVVSLSVHERAFAHYHAVLQRWAEEAKGPRQKQALEEMDAEIGHARAAWDWAVVHAEPAELAGAIDGLCLYYDRRARTAEGESACRVAVDRLDAPSDDAGTAEIARLRALSKALTWHSRFLPREAAMAAAQRSLALLEGPVPAGEDVRAERAAALRRLGDLQMDRSRREAGRCYDACLALYRALRDPWHVAQALLDRGRHAWHVSAFEGAERFFAESLALARELGDLRTVADATAGLSGVRMAAGDHHEAAALSEEVLTLSRELGDPMGIADALYSLGFKRLNLGQSAEAIDLLEACIAIYRDQFGLPHPLAVSVIGWARMFQGAYEEALTDASAAYERMRAARSRRGTAWGRFVIGGIYLGQGRLAEAEEVLKEAVAGYRPLQQQLELALTLALLGTSRALQGRLEQARTDLIEALQIGLSSAAANALTFGVAGSALLCALEGEPLRATTLYAALHCCPQAGFSPWFADVFGRRIEAAAARLQPEEVAQARERGRAGRIREVAADILAAS